MYGRYWSYKSWNRVAFCYAGSPPTPLVKMSSPSVPVFHQSSIPDLKFGSASSVNSRENLETNNHGSFDNSGRCHERLTFSPCVPNKFRTGSQQGLASFGLPHEQKQVDLVNLPLETQSSSKGSSNLLSTCKNSCRLFGFPSTESSPTIPKECNPNPVHSPYVQNPPRQLTSLTQILLR